MYTTTLSLQACDDTTRAYIYSNAVYSHVLTGLRYSDNTYGDRLLTQCDRLQDQPAGSACRISLQDQLAGSACRTSLQDQLAGG